MKSKAIIAKIDLISMYGFFLAFFLIKLPPLYIVPFIYSPLNTTYSLFTILIILLTFSKFILTKRNLIKKDKQLLVVFVIYLIFASLSIINTTNIKDYLQIYKNVLIAGLFLFVTIEYKIHGKKIIILLVSASSITLLYQLFAFFYPDIFKLFGRIFIEQKHFNLVNLDLNRGRIFTETYDEIVLPLVYYLFIITKNKKIRFALATSFFLIIIPSFLSNFRTRILMVIVGAASTLFFLAKQKMKYFFFVFAGFVFVGYVVSIFSSYFFGYSYIDRFFFANESDSIAIESRFTGIDYSLRVGLAYPLFGVGLGNYYQYLPNRNKFSDSLNMDSKALTEIAIHNPHNIFAQVLVETGLFSLTFYVFMLFLFIKADLITLRNKQYVLQKAFIISFWTLFTYSLFNPTTSLPYNSLFWSLRALSNYDKSTH